MFTKHQRMTRRRKASKNHETQDEDDDDDDEEILIREKTGRLLGSLPFQAPTFSQTQPDDYDDDDDDDNDNNSAEERVQPVSSRRHGRWRQRKRGRAVFQQTKNDSATLSKDAKQDDDLPLKNDFAELEAMLATQEEDEQKKAAYEKSDQTTTESAPKQSVMDTGNLEPGSRHLNASDTGNSPPNLPKPEEQEDVLDVPMHEVDVEENDTAKRAHHFERREEVLHPLETPAAVMRTTSSIQKVDVTTEMAMSLLEKSRRFAKKQIKSATNRSFRPPKTAKGPVAVKNVKSIVGSRPTHWGASSSVRPLTNAHRLQLNTKRSKPDLAAVLSRSGGKSMLTSLSSPPLKRTRTTHQEGAATTPPHSGIKASRNDSEQHQNSFPEEHEHTTAQPPGNEPVSFAPSFVSMMTSPHGTLTEEEQAEAVEDGGAGEDNNNNNNVFPNPLHSSPSPSRARKGGRSKASSSAAGPLLKRLSAIRDGVKGDTVRFQSGQYPFSMSSLDMNDPRNRAKTYMDVTILGNSMERQHQRVTLLGFVHTFALKAAAAASKVERETASSSTATTLQPNSLAWICLTYETAREKKVGVGSQLRIYNAVPVPLTVPLIQDDDDEKNRTSASPHSNVKWIVLCTSLCESYPNCLPKLPNVETILST